MELSVFFGYIKVLVARVKRLKKIKENPLSQEWKGNIYLDLYGVCL